MKNRNRETPVETGVDIENSTEWNSTDNIITYLKTQIKKPW
jgi:hypothetical protein